MKQQYALSFLKVGSIAIDPAYTLIPAGTEPEVELQAFFDELDRNHIDHKEQSPGLYRVTLLAGQEWEVRVITVGDLEDTQPMQAVAS